MSYVDYLEAYNFFFTVNKKARLFLIKNFLTIQNEYINDGLIPFKLGPNF